MCWLPSGTPRAGRRLTSVISLAVHVFFLVLVIAAGALHLFLHLLQLIQVNPSNQLEVTAHLKRPKQWWRNEPQTERARPGGESFPRSFSCNCFWNQDWTTPVPKRSFPPLWLGFRGRCSHIPPFSVELSTLGLPYQTYWDRWVTLCQKSKVSWGLGSRGSVQKTVFWVESKEVTFVNYPSFKCCILPHIMHTSPLNFWGEKIRVCITIMGMVTPCIMRTNPWVCRIHRKRWYIWRWRGSLYPES